MKIVTCITLELCKFELYAVMQYTVIISILCSNSALYSLSAGMQET
jgi:hypothetical protein